MAKKNKNKIRILDSNQDLDALFTDEKREITTDINETDTPLNKTAHGFKNFHEIEPEPEMSSQEFAELLDLSLKGKSMDRLMQEKKERGAPQKVPLKKRLKRYPPPESRLDLHGFTGTGANVKADSYIRTAFQNGIFTIKIIVGKGIHSEFGAILPTVIEDLLVKLKNEKIVLHFAWEKKKKGKSGAILVYLNQFND